MISSYKFIQKLWLIHTEIKNKITKENKDNFDSKIENFTNELISKITNNLEKFNYNVIIANMYETYNYLVEYLRKNKNIKNLEQNYIKILISFMPIIQHFTSECLEDLNYKGNIYWPEYDENLLEKREIKFVIQINGKKRALLEVKKDVEEKNLMGILKKDKNVNKYFIGKK